MNRTSRRAEEERLKKSGAELGSNLPEMLARVRGMQKMAEEKYGEVPPQETPQPPKKEIEIPRADAAKRDMHDRKQLGLDY